MAKSKGTLRTCRKGHKYYKSSDCPTCPECKAEQKSITGFLSLISAPARRALHNAGINTLQDLSKYSEAQILSLHGMGKASMPILRSELDKVGFKFEK